MSKTAGGQEWIVRKNTIRRRRLLSTMPEFADAVMLVHVIIRYIKQLK